MKPVAENLENTRQTYVKLFTSDNFTDELPYEFEYEGDKVDDSIPKEDEIRQALFRMRSIKAPGLSRLSVDHFKEWYKLAYPKNGEKGDTEALARWNMVVELVQRCLGDGDIPNAFKYGVLVIIPKDYFGGVHGIGLLEVIHKLISQTINLRMAQKIQFCEEVHGFWTKRGTYTAIGEVKLRMQMIVCSLDTMYQVYLDLRKAYDSIDRGHILQIMRKYRVGPQLCRYVEDIWADQQFFLHQNGFYSDPVEVERGYTQGDIDPPIIFNLIIDAVIRTWKPNPNFRDSKGFFCADDGLIEHTDAKKLQSDLDDLIQLFERVGLKANETKTKVMKVRGAAEPSTLRQEVYDKIAERRRGGITTTHAQHCKEQVTCTICGKAMQRASLHCHMNRQHSVNISTYRCREVLRHQSVGIDSFIKGTFNKCPVDGCTGGARDIFGMYCDFGYIHLAVDVTILEDGILDKCELCGM